MRLILHIGSSKTGTTTVQQFFCRNQAALLADGFFYPMRSSHTPQHVLIPAGFVQKRNYSLPNNRFYMDNSNRFWRSFDSFWKKMLDDIEEYKPHTVILSAETLFDDFSSISEKSFSEFLGEYFSDVSIVAYIRSPSADYKSRIFQQIRTAKQIMPPHVRPIRQVIEYYEHEFPGNVHVYPFEKEQLLGGDILRDFLTKNTPELLHLIKATSTEFKNVSLSPVLLKALQKIRLEEQPEGRLPKISTNALVVWATEAYEKERPTAIESETIGLRDDINLFLQSSAIDYKWLREVYGVTFSDLDYSKIEEKDNPYSDLFLLEDICVLGSANNKLRVDVRVPASKFLRLLITLRFILKTQLTGFYKAKISYSWLGKIKRAVLKTA